MEDKDKEKEKEKFHQHLPGGIILPYLCILRIINALTINTFFQADEYWQSLEPAHELVFGYGSLTWEWQLGLRGFLHPLLFSLVYKCSELLDLGELGVLYLPKITQAVIASIGELYLYKFVYKVTRNEVIARWCLFLSVVSVFNWYLITRTFSNSLELSLTCIALAYWPWDNRFVVDFWCDLDKSLAFAAVCCFLRPTNGLIWMVLGVQLLYRSKEKFKVMLHVISVFVIVFCVNFVIDYWYYGKVTIPIWNFVKFNLFASLSKFYGVAPWHFHLFQSVPLILLTYLPFCIFGLLKYDNITLKLVVVLTILVFSMIGHKEFRFLYPIQPILLLFSSYGCHHVNLHHPTLMKYITYCVIVINTLLSMFLTQVHERGVIDVVNHLRDDVDVYSVGFLTPCHSTPWQAYLHREDLQSNSWFLTCEPPLHLLDDVESSAKVEAYMDESDYFYEDPLKFLHENFPPPFKRKDLDTPGKEYKYYWPSHLVFFEDLEPVMKDYLKDSAYVECNRFFNSYFHWDDRRRGDVVVYCKWPWE